MSNINLLQPLVSPQEAAFEIAKREKAFRKKMGINQQELAACSGVTLGSIRRFEQTGQIAFESLLRICRALDCESDLDVLFARPAYKNIQEVIDAQRK